MRRHIFLLVFAAVIFSASLTFGQWTVEIEPYIESDYYEFLYDLDYAFGVDPSSSAGFDSLDSISLPVPPEVRFVIPSFYDSCFVSSITFWGINRDMRSSEDDTVYWEFHFVFRDSTTGYMEEGADPTFEEVGIRWDPADLPIDGDFHLGFFVDTLRHLCRQNDNNPGYPIDWHAAIDLRDENDIKFTFDEAVYGRSVIRYVKHPSKVAEARPLPVENQLAASPNPFNSTVEINVAAGHDLCIYDSNGRLVEKFGRQSQNGKIIWQPDETLESGVYFITSQNAASIRTGKLIYLK